MVDETIEEGICTSQSRNSVVSEKSGKGNPNESRIELENNLQAKHSALLAEDGNISN